METETQVLIVLFAIGITVYSLRLRGKVILLQIQENVLSFTGYIIMWFLVHVLSYYLDSVIALVIAYTILTEIAHQTINYPPYANLPRPRTMSGKELTHTSFRAFAMFCVSVVWWIINRDNIGLAGSIIGLLGILNIYPSADRHQHRDNWIYT